MVPTEVIMTVLIEHQNNRKQLALLII